MIQITEIQATGSLQRPRLQVALVAPRLVAAHAEADADPVGPVQEDRADGGDAADDEERVAAEGLGQRRRRARSGASSRPRSRSTAFAGVRYRCETFLSQPEPGTPSSRLNANSIRPAEAIDEKPQKVIAIAIAGGAAAPAEAVLEAR